MAPAEPHALGAPARRTVAAGELIGDGHVEKVVRDRLEQHDWNYGFIIDGFPRARCQIRRQQRGLGAVAALPARVAGAVTPDGARVLDALGVDDGRRRLGSDTQVARQGLGHTDLLPLLEVPVHGLPGEKIGGAGTATGNRTGLHTGGR
ncbi:nucleoside monophosphate kinase [Nonomuraea sp. NPDC050310]|uniref:nucleoside monophosphate kinase n=1 Tax=Nonomuraea sp. NPDC050310 TaxID=3154935 RepID=UPI0033D0F1DD